MDSSRPRRDPIKSRRRPDWREELRSNCLKRIKEERVQFLWKKRIDGPLPASDMIKVESAVRDIISDELQKLKQHGDGKADQEADMIWEYQGPQTAKPVETESEDILLEMERLLYEDMRDEAIQIEVEALDEEDEYLAQAFLEHMQLTDKEINLEFLRERLANVHMDHLDRGCKSAPKFCLQTMFELTALYIQCEECNTFDVVI
uniref:RPA-interacting protein N-terminal domain-containing protein n=2 Tax=Oryza nivara TaxID=4536 RepID=A0A0E0HEJ1_ORYNI